MRLLGLALFVFALTAFSGPGRIDIEDGQARFEAGRNLVEQGRPSIEDPRSFPYFNFPGRGGYQFTHYRFPGEVIAAISIVLADTVSSTEPWRHFVFTLSGSVLAAILAVLYACAFRQQHYSWNRSILWALLGIVCTPCWYYATSTFDDLLCTVCVVFTLVAARQSQCTFFWIVPAAVGVALSLNAKQPLAAVIFPALALSASNDRKWLRFAILWLGEIAGYGIYVGYEYWKFPPETRIVHAELLAERGVTVFGGNPAEAILDYLAGPSSGTLWYASATILGIIGLIRQPRMVVVSFLVAIMAIVGFFCLLTFYKGGVCWGPRYLTPVYGMLWLFAPAGAARVGWLIATVLLTAGFIVQVMGLALIPERLYVERELHSSFYTVNPWWYFEPSLSHIYNRPREMLDAAAAPDAPDFTPAPTSTSSLPVLDPPFYTGPKGIAGVRHYTVLNTFRPWWATHRHWPRHERPIAIVETAVALGGFMILGLALVLRGRHRT